MTLAVRGTALALGLLGCNGQTVNAVEGVNCLTAGGGCSAQGGSSSGGGASVSGGAPDVLPFKRPICRYSFNGVGTRAVDSEGGPDATVVNTTLSGNGDVVLEGNDQYIDLPNQILDRVNSATFESWLSWDGGAAWQRVFDFGEDETGRDGSRAVQPRDYFFFTVLNREDQGASMRVTYMQPGGGEIILDAPDGTSFPIGAAPHHVAVVVDPDNRLLRLYLDGLHLQSIQFQSRLAEIYDINNWLGRSQFNGDPSLSGRYLEFRIFDIALNPSQIKQSYDAGPDASFQ